jgi:hypothetical protein
MKVFDHRIIISPALRVRLSLARERIEVRVEANCDALLGRGL